MCSPAYPSYGVCSKRWEMCEILLESEQSDFWYLVCSDLSYISSAGAVISTYSLSGAMSATPVKKCFPSLSTDLLLYQQGITVSQKSC